MNLSQGQRELISRTIAEGARKSGEKLAKMSKKNWAISTKLLSDGPAERFRIYLGGSIQPHFGAYLPMQDGSPLAILVIFSAKNGQILTQAFTSGLGHRIETIQDLQTQTLAEISNILAHALAGSLADALQTLIILSAPQVTSGPRCALLDEALKKFKSADSFIMLSTLSLASPEAAVDCNLIILIDTTLILRLLKPLNLS